MTMKTTTDRVLKELGLERRRGSVQRVAPVLAGVGLGALAGLGLYALGRSRKVRAMVETVRHRFRGNGAHAPSETAPEEVHA